MGDIHEYRGCATFACGAVSEGMGESIYGAKPSRVVWGESEQTCSEGEWLGGE